MAAGLLMTAAIPAAAAEAAPSQNCCDNRTNNTYDKLLECVRVEGVREHQAAFQAAADANGGTRAAGTQGYTDSVDYVVEQLEAAGWDVELNEFPFTFTPLGELDQLTPISASYETGSFSGTGFGLVTGQVIPVDLALAPPQASTSGCEATDFSGLDFSGPADIALIQRGTSARCTHVRRAPSRLSPTPFRLPGGRRGYRTHHRQKGSAHERRQQDPAHHDRRRNPGAE